MKGYFYLAISIVSEVFSITMLKMADGFTVLLPSIGVVFGYALTFYFLSLCLKTVPLSLAYGIWSGVGTALTAVIGIFVWNDPFNTATFLGILLIIFGVFLLNGSTNTERATTD